MTKIKMVMNHPYELIKPISFMHMWMVNPQIMCRNHLLEEHAEIHMFVWNIDQKRSVKGYITKELLETHSLYGHHEELAHELKRRGYHTIQS